MISLVVPCYNVKAFIKDFTECVFVQTYTHFEVIFVDDGSVDGTAEYLEKLCAGEEKFILLRQKNGGPAAARNAGIAKAKGEWLVFADADDMFAPEYLEKLLDAAQNADIAACGVKWAGENCPAQKAVASGKNSTTYCENQEKFLLDLLSGKKYLYSVWNKIYSRRVIEQAGVFDEGIFYGEDLEFNFRCFSACSRIAYTPKKLYFYRKCRGGIVRSKFNERKLTVQEGAQKMQKGAKFAKVLQYAKAFECLACTEMLCRILATNYSSRAKIASLLEGIKRNRGSMLRAKGFALYKRLFIPAAYPLLKIAFAKRMESTTRRERSRQKT